MSLKMLPGRHKLLLSAAVWIIGIQCTAYGALPLALTGIAAGVLLAAMLLQLRERKRPTALLLLFLLTAGYVYGCIRIVPKDEGYAGHGEIRGTIRSVLSENAVLLDRVETRDGVRMRRSVRMTLLLEEGESAELLPGQVVSGEGKLFSQERKRNPGGRDRLIGALCGGYELSGYLLPGWTLEGEGHLDLSERVRRLRNTLDERIGTLFGETAGLFRAILIGVRTELDDSVYTAMQLTGIAHLLSVSGLHLSLIAGLLGALLTRCRMDRRASFVIKLIVLLGFTLLTGAAAGTIRALIMALLQAYLVLRGRKYDSLSALSIAAFLMTAVNPAYALQSAFRLSFSIVLGILLIYPVCQKKLRTMVRNPVLRSFALAMALCVSAQLAAIPMQLVLYGYVPVLSVPMNLICASFLPVLMLGGWMSVAISFIAPSLAAALGGTLGICALGMERLSLFVSTVPFAIVRLPAWGPVMAWLALFTLWAMFGGALALVLRAVLPVVSAAAILLLWIPAFLPGSRIAMLDVGQGDAVVLSRGRHAVVMDVGPSGQSAVLQYLRHEGLILDGILLSHLDSDHVGALEGILSCEIGPAPIVMPAKAEEQIDADETILTVLQSARDAGIPVLEAERGDAFELMGVRFRVLSPDPIRSGSNERSLVLLAEPEGIRYLSMGDLPGSGEGMIGVPCDVLKVAHHGSASSTSEEFLDRIQPSLALISVGKNNNYGHPAQRVLTALSDRSIQTLRTDEAGCISLRLKDGRVSRISDFLKP